MVLIAKDYRILARRFKTPAGEIDIVARCRRSLVFVAANAPVTRLKQWTDRTRQRVVAAVELWPPAISATHKATSAST